MSGQITAGFLVTAAKSHFQEGSSQEKERAGKPRTRDQEGSDQSLLPLQEE